MKKHNRGEIKAARVLQRVPALGLCLPALLSPTLALMPPSSHPPSPLPLPLSPPTHRPPPSTETSKTPLLPFSVSHFKKLPIPQVIPITFCSLPRETIPFFHPSAAAAKSLQSCLTLCDPIDGSPPGSPIPGILQAKLLESVAISFSNA